MLGLPHLVFFSCCRQQRPPAARQARVPSFCPAKPMSSAPSAVAAWMHAWMPSVVGLCAETPQATISNATPKDIRAHSTPHLSTSLADARAGWTVFVWDEEKQDDEAIEMTVSPDMRVHVHSYICRVCKHSCAATCIQRSDKRPPQVTQRVAIPDHHHWPSPALVGLKPRAAMWPGAPEGDGRHPCERFGLWPGRCGALLAIACLRPRE